MTTRMRQRPGTEKTSRLPKTPFEWDNLMRKVLARAKEQGDRRHQGLTGAIERGQSATVLRRMGIISEADILREFPGRKT